MFCEKCGEQINNGAKFCPNCGAPTDGSTPIINSSNSKTSIIEKIKARKLPITIAAVILILAIVIISLVSFFNGRISMNDYINYDSVVATGYNGYASIDYNNIIDYSRLIEDLGEHKYDDNWLDDEVSVEGIEDFLYGCIDISLKDAEGNSNWSNGDKYTIEVTIDYDHINKFHFEKKLVGSKDGYSKSLEVSGLADPIVIDPFECLDVVRYDLTTSYASFLYNEKFEKTYGEYTFKFNESFNSFDDRLVVLDSSGKTAFYVNLQCSQPDDYEKTKTVTLNVSETNFLDEFGIVLSPSEKQIKPHEIDYLRDVSKLRKDDYKEIKKQAIEWIFRDDYHNCKKYVDSFFVTKEDNINALVFVYTDNTMSSMNYLSANCTNIKIDTTTNEALLSYISFGDHIVFEDGNYVTAHSLKEVKENYFSDYKISPIKY